MARSSYPAVGSPLVVRQLSPRKHHDASAEQAERAEQHVLNETGSSSTSSVRSGVDFRLIKTILHHNRIAKRGWAGARRYEVASKQSPRKNNIAGLKPRVVSEHEHLEAQDSQEKAPALQNQPLDNLVSPRPVRSAPASRPPASSPKLSVSSCTTPEFLDTSLLLDDFLTITPGDYWTGRNVSSYLQRRHDTSPGKKSLTSPPVADRFYRQTKQELRNELESFPPSFSNYRMYSTGNPKLFLETSPSRKERRSESTDHFLRQINNSVANQQVDTNSMQGYDGESHFQALRASELYRHSRSPEMKDSSRRSTSSLSIRSRVRDDWSSEEQSTLERKTNKLNVLIPQVLSSPDEYDDCEGQLSPVS
uniref:Uncharacterized protein n=1 Tax=Guillardia theta TaxID=55529 RepID=A0A6U5X163_GUITH|mmetsp:Transcript_16389/g.54865  ORF Transcript_16389/g.54865 Transcript_16389/m.54865 type:complete len:364 (+) Transcript_16389:151-1242(+)